MLFVFLFNELEEPDADEKPGNGITAVIQVAAKVIEREDVINP